MNKRTLLLILLESLLMIAPTGCQNQSESLDAPNREPKWWKEAIIYQIYPRSFKDSNDDGIGDLQGIIEKLDYIKSLGVNAIWLNPIYKSPNVDNGYDVSDYRDIMEDFGTMEDFDNLLEELKRRDIKLIMDIVVNHSSNQHKWFIESSSSRDNPYRDYYHWWPAEKGKPNYRYSLFDEKGDAWQYDAKTDAYYLHYFAKEQPDLNWENPKVRQEVLDIMKFWAEKGVNGFRLDAFQFVSKDTTFPKLPEGYEKKFIKYYGMGPNLHQYLREIYSEVLNQYDVFAVSEGVGSTLEDAHSLVDEDRNELQMAYHFESMEVGYSLDRYLLSEFKEVFTKWDLSFSKKGWLSIYLGNHDQPRMVSRFGNDDPQFREASSKLLNTFILSMRGTPYCYYGDEIGMTNIDFQSIDQYNDLVAINMYNKNRKEGKDLEQYMKELNFLSRDNSRTPMQWNSSHYGGFSYAKPWLEVNKNYERINVEDEEKDPNSVLNHFRTMAQIRKNNPVLIYGDYEVIDEDNSHVFAYKRQSEDTKLVIVLNFSAENATISINELSNQTAILINNYRETNVEQNVLSLQPYQAVIFSQS